MRRHETPSLFGSSCASCASLANQTDPLLVIYKKTVRRSLLDRGHANGCPESSLLGVTFFAKTAHIRQGSRETRRRCRQDAIPRLRILVLIYYLSLESHRPPIPLCQHANSKNCAYSTGATRNAKAMSTQFASPLSNPRRDLLFITQEPPAQNSANFRNLLDMAPVRPWPRKTIFGEIRKAS